MQLFVLKNNSSYYYTIFHCFFAILTYSVFYTILACVFLCII